MFEHDLLGMCELCISDSSPLCSSPLYGHYGYDQDIDSFRSSREASALSHLALVAFTINAELADYLNDALGHTPQPRASGGGLLRSWLDGRLSAEDLLGTLVAQLHLAPTLTGRACAAIYEVEWSLLLLLLGAVAWLLTVLYLATRRHKYNLMLTLAAMKQELADDSKSILDSDGDRRAAPRVDAALPPTHTPPRAPRTRRRRQGEREREGGRGQGLPGDAGRAARPARPRRQPLGDHHADDPSRERAVHPLQEVPGLAEAEPGLRDAGARQVRTDLGKDRAQGGHAVMARGLPGALEPHMQTYRRACGLFVHVLSELRAARVRPQARLIPRGGARRRTCTECIQY